MEFRKPKIGMLGIIHGLYDESQPEIDHEGIGQQQGCGQTGANRPR